MVSIIIINWDIILIFLSNFNDLMLKILIVSAFPPIIIPMMFANDYERQIALAKESAILAVILVGIIMSA